MAARTVTVDVLSARAELLAVLRTAMAVIAAVWLYVALAEGTGSRASAPRNLLPFQQLMAERSPDEQRMFRELQEGLLEAESRRADAGTWPPPATLAEEGVPPFAADPTRKRPYDWSLVTGGIFINYLGLPRDDGSAWLLLIQEPVPGVPPDQNVEDEEHHRLSNGTMLHVSAWVHANGSKIARHIIRMPQAEGWTQLYAVGPPTATTTR
jgi:hypothetical protein